jgi:hypothetical protein
MFFGSSSWSRASQMSRARRGAGLVEDGDDAGVIRVLGQVQHDGLGGDPVGEGGDGLSSDREVLEMGFGLPQSSVQLLDLGAEVVGQGPGRVFLSIQCFEQRLDVHAVTA